MVNGVSYRKEHGAKLHTVTTILTKTSFGIETMDWLPYHNYKWTRGTSYVQNTEIGYLHYRGRAHAMGNVYFGERVIQAIVTYSRNGSVIKQGVDNYE